MSKNIVNCAKFKMCNTALSEYLVCYGYHMCFVPPAKVWSLTVRMQSVLCAPSTGIKARIKMLCLHKRGCVGKVILQLCHAWK